MVLGLYSAPTGTEKTFAMRQACHKMPKGTLYFEIKGIHEFPKWLAEAIGMHTERTIIGTIIGRWFPSSVHGYYDLPAEYEECLDYVTRRLGERAEVFANKHGHSPCLFIDGSDLLAKHDHKVFVKLVDLAKGYANEGRLHLFFGSEGHTIPLIFTATSSNTRCSILEVVDLTEDEAVEYLINWGLDREFSNLLVETIGSRMIFLERAVRFYHQFKPEYNTEEEIFRKVVEEFKVVFTKRGLDAIVLEMPQSREIINHLTSFNIEIGFDPQNFFEEHEKEVKQKAMRESVKSPVRNNTLRYTRMGNITRHNRGAASKKRFLKE